MTLATIDIPRVWRLLSGGELRAGKQWWAFWREGDGYNVSLAQAEGVFYDHRDGRGGGVLDVLEVVLGIDRGAIDRVAMSYAAAVPLSALFSEQSDGFHFYGPTSVGKTTGRTGAGSLWGGGIQDGPVSNSSSRPQMPWSPGRSIPPCRRTLETRLSQYHPSTGDRSFRRHIYIDLLEKLIKKSSKAGLGWSVLESTNLKGRGVRQDFAETQP